MIGYIVSILVHGDYISEFPRVASVFLTFWFSNTVHSKYHLT
jgi:hypothetical protein